MIAGNSPHVDRRQTRWRSLMPPAVLAAVYLLLTFGVMFGGGAHSPQQWDMDEYHWPTIKSFAADWPHPNLESYNSATGPGLHILLALVYRATGSELAARLTVVAIGLVFVVLMYAIARRVLIWKRDPVPNQSGWTACALSLPVVCSPYTLGSLIWIATDAPALLFVMLALAGSVMFPFRARIILLAGLAAAIAVSIRQIHAWTIAPLGFAGVLASPLVKFVPGVFRDDRLQEPRSWSNVAAGALAAAMPLGVVVWFVSMWGGLIPNSPEMRGTHGRGVNVATFAFALAVAGCFGPFFVFSLSNPLATLRRARRWIVIGAGIALVASLAVTTSEVWPERSGGIVWLLAKKFSSVDVFDRSPVIVLFAVVGAAVIATLTQAASDAGRRATALFLLLAMFGWACAQAANPMAWQRYFAPIELIALAWLTAMGWNSKHDPADRPLPRRISGLIVLGVAQAGMTIAVYGLGSSYGADKTPEKVISVPQSSERAP